MIKRVFLTDAMNNQYNILRFVYAIMKFSSYACRRTVLRFNCESNLLVYRIVVDLFLFLYRGINRLLICLCFSLKSLFENFLPMISRQNGRYDATQVVDALFKTFTIAANLLPFTFACLWIGKFPCTYLVYNRTEVECHL